MSSYLGHILIREGIINLSQLRVAIGEQKRTGRRLGEVLIDLEYASEDQLVDSLSKEYGLLVINLDEFEIDPVVLNLVPKRTALKHNLVPINHSGSTLFVAMSDPSDIVTVDDIGFATGYDIKPVIASEGAIKNAIERYYGTKDRLNEQKAEENSVKEPKAEGEIRESSTARSKWDEFIKQVEKASLEARRKREKETLKSNAVHSQDRNIVQEKEEEPRLLAPQEGEKEEDIEPSASVSQEIDSIAREWLSSKTPDKEESFKPYSFSFYGTNVQEQEEKVGSEAKGEEEILKLSAAPSQENDSLKKNEETGSEAPREAGIGSCNLLSYEGDPVWKQKESFPGTEHTNKEGSKSGSFNFLEHGSSSELDSNEPEEEPFKPNDYSSQENAAPHTLVEERSIIEDTVVMRKENAFSLYPGSSDKGSLSSRRTILIIDDSPTIQKIVSITLEQEGYRVLIASDGMQAMARLNEAVPDLILLGINLPHMDGYQVCKIIKGNSLIKDVPVIMLSGKDGFFDKMRGRMAGATDYITKPFQPATLLRAVEKHCGERRARRLHIRDAHIISDLFSVEDMKISDEQRGKNELLAQDEKVLSQHEIEQGVVLQNSLLVLSNLEQLMVQLEKAYKQPILAIQFLSEIVNQVVEFSETLQGGDTEAVHLAKVITRERDKYPMLRLLHTQKNRLSVQTAMNLLNDWAGDLWGRQDVFNRICQGMIIVLESYCLLFADYFRSSRTYDHWRESYGVFLFDLKLVVNKIQF